MKATTLHSMEVAKRAGTGSGGGGGDIEKRVEIVEEKVAGYAEYSTDEVDTGKEWVDGKRIYKKTVLMDVTTRDFNIDLGDVNIINVFGFLNFTRNYAYIKLPVNYYEDGTRYFNFQVKDKKIEISIGSTFLTSDTSLELSVEYTKD